jgi:beta-lactamase class D
MSLLPMIVAAWWIGFHALHAAHISFASNKDIRKR